MSRRLSEESAEEGAPLLASIPPSPISEDGSFEAFPGAAQGVDRHSSRSTNIKIAATMYSFIVLGLFTSSVGVMISPLADYYSLKYVHVSFVFLATPIGYIFGAQTNAIMHSKFGQRGVAVVGPVLHIIAAVAIAAHPPFPALLVAYAVLAMGTGYLDGSWCTFASGRPNANLVSGLLHGSFSAGAAVGPFFGGNLMYNATRPWYEYYYILLGASLLELLVLAYAFRHENASKYHHSKRHMLEIMSTSSTKEIFKYRAIWIGCAFFLTYVGNETAISGWIVSFMMQARHASPFLAVLTSTGFWAGMAVGRFALGYVTDRIGVRRATTFYLLSVIVLTLLFTLITRFTRSSAASVVIVSFVGFFMGPLFPSGVIVLTRLLPKELHVAAVSLVASLGQVGAAALPFGIGAMTELFGIDGFAWVLLAFLIIAFVLWVAFASLPERTVCEVVLQDEDEA